VALLAFGLRGASDVGSGGGGPPPSAQGEEAKEGVAPPVAATGSPGPDVTVSPGAAAVGVIDRLPDGAVLRVTAAGFEPGAAGEVAQCGLSLEGPRSCTNRFPVQFDGEGVALFQYLISDRPFPAGGRCGAADPPCVLVVTGPGGDGPALSLTVFRDPAPPAGRITVEPHSGLSGADVVTVRASGFLPATRLVAGPCAASPDTGRCGPTVSTHTGADGAAVLRLPLTSGEGDGPRCGPRAPCEVRVMAEAAVAPLSTAVSFSAGPSARYDPRRLAAGLVVVLLLLGLAAWLVRTTDWREPAEAATPDMDRAVLEG
jgi:hypothetical protein